jgi:hypothetical protein
MLPTNSKLNPARLPVLRFSRVIHLGTFRKRDKRRYSHEGHGISVSRCPDEWRRIARLGGMPEWELKYSKAQFLNRHRLGKRQLQGILRWAEAQGLLKQKPQFELSWFDDELNDTCTAVFSSREKALEELPDEEDPSAIREVLRYCATTDLNRRMGFRVPALHAEDLAIVCFVEDQTSLDGVWWNDILDTFSAPRGVILPDRLSRWQRTALH